MPSLSDMERGVMCENEKELTGLHFWGLLSVLYILRVVLEASMMCGAGT